MIAILGAMDCEIEEFVSHAEDLTSSEWAGSTFYTANLEGQAVVIAQSGVGKVLAAMVTQRIIDIYSPEFILFTGIAGGINPDFNIGDVVVARDCVQHDLDTSPLGFSRGQIPFTEYRYIEGNARLRKLALGCVAEGIVIREGRVATGDQFLTSKSHGVHDYLKNELQADAVEMEGASVATVATYNGVPFALLRTISDKADSTAPSDFAMFLPQASRNSYLITSHILRELRSFA